MAFNSAPVAGVGALAARASMETPVINDQQPATPHQFGRTWTKAPGDVGLATFTSCAEALHSNGKFCNGKQFKQSYKEALQFKQFWEEFDCFGVLRAITTNHETVERCWDARLLQIHLSERKWVGYRSYTDKTKRLMTRLMTR